MVVDQGFVNFRREWLVFPALVLAVSLQGLHFHFYFDQDVSKSVVWSFVDWSSWFLIIGGLFLGFQKAPQAMRQKFYWPIFAGVIVFGGPLQIILSNFLNGLIYPPGRTFLEDIIHLYDKRWLQNLLYAGLLFKFFDFLKPLVGNSSKGKAEILKVSDGKTLHWLRPEEIRFIEAAGNYLVLHTGGQEIMTRESLKDFKARVGDFGFLQINRSYLVNPQHIRRMEPYSRYSKQIVLENGTKIQIGRTYLQRIQKVLGG